MLFYEIVCRQWGPGAKVAMCAMLVVQGQILLQTEFFPTVKMHHCILLFIISLKLLKYCKIGPKFAQKCPNVLCNYGVQWAVFDKTGVTKAKADFIWLHCSCCEVPCVQLSPYFSSVQLFFLIWVHSCTFDNRPLFLFYAALLVRICILALALRL